MKSEASPIFKCLTSFASPKISLLKQKSKKKPIKKLIRPSNHQAYQLLVATQLIKNHLILKIEAQQQLISFLVFQIKNKDFHATTLNRSLRAVMNKIIIGKETHTLDWRGHQ